MKVYTAGSDSSLKTLAARIFVAILFSSFAGAAWGQGAIKTKFEAWEFRCETPAGETSEQCALTQTVNAEDAANVKLGVMIIKPKQTKTGCFGSSRH